MASRKRQGALRNAGMDTVRDRAKLNTTSSAVAGVIDNLRSQLQQLEREIKADHEGKKEFENELYLMDKERGELQARLARNRDFAKQFDVDIGPFQAKYDQLTAEISTLYDNAKGEHQKGVELLEREFGYHRMFRKPDADFFAIPFVPK